MARDLGRIFDATSEHSLPPDATAGLVDHYFAAGELDGKVVLDAGCRVGDYSLALLARGAGRVVGVDLSGRCIARARERSRGDARLRFLQGDIAELGAFAASELDLVVCVGTLMYLDGGQARRAMREMIRVTRPGGSILALFLRPRGWPMRLATAVANRLPLGVYLRSLEVLGRAARPLARRLAGREVGMEILKYDKLWGLQGLHYGVPFAIPDRYRVPTADTPACSPAMVVSYRIPVPGDKEQLLAELPGLESRRGSAAPPAGENGATTATGATG